MLEWITRLVSSTGYFALIALMFLENVFPPIPSELIMPLAGFSVSKGELSFMGVLLAGTAGSVLGSLVLYGLGRKVGKKRLGEFIDRHGRWLTVGRDDLERATHWLEKHGVLAVFVGRLVPALRSLVSLPAGVNRMGLSYFVALTTAGSLVWNLVLTGLGYLLRSRFEQVEKFVSPISISIVALLVAWYVYRVLTHKGDRPREQANDTGTRQPETSQAR